MEFENVGDWCKWLERNFTCETMIPTLPVIIRLDGNNFSRWTKGLHRPFDQGLVELMRETTRYLVEETNAVIGYTQSDEITLVLYSENRSSELYHNGKKQKILSKLTAKCVNFFNEARETYLPKHDKSGVRLSCISGPDAARRLCAIAVARKRCDQKQYLCAGKKHVLAQPFNQPEHKPDARPDDVGKKCELE